MWHDSVRKGLMLALGLGLCGVAWVVAQGAHNARTDIFDFLNGFQLNGGTVITGTTGAQNSAVVLPANSVGGAELSGAPIELIYCGQADENGTIYLSPTAGVNGVDLGDGVDYSISGTACDGLDGATEATQDLILFPEVAFKIMGGYCQQAGAEALGAGETIVFHYRAAAANVTPDLTCTISEAQRGCAIATGTTTNIAANAATAVQAVMTSNNTDSDLWCSFRAMLLP
jgi:hypothetical protein